MSSATAAASRRPHTSRRAIPVATTLAFAVLAVMVLCAVLDGLAPQDPEAINGLESLQGPSSDHLLGTDQLGRDVFSRMIAGARTSLLGPTLLALGVAVVGAVVAMLAGYFGGRLDAVVSRVVDVLYSIPALMVAVIVVGVTGGGFGITVLVLTVFNLPLAIRNLRAAVMERAQLPYMEAARTLGVPTWRILLTHLLPVISPFVVATFFIQFTYGVVELSSMSFLGLGVPPGASDWGRMVADNRGSMYGNVWATAAPAIGIVLLAVSTNLIGEWISSRYEKAGETR
jgi:ABC-type dipeptide/oligopeptide/nickel transport system permease subunit